MSEKKETEPKKGIKIDDGIVERLEETVRKLGIEVRYEQMQKPGYAGGLCRVKKKWVLIVNRSSMPLEKVQLLADTISSKDTNNIYLPPDVREVIAWAVKKRRSGEEKD